MQFSDDIWMRYNSFSFSISNVTYELIYPQKSEPVEFRRRVSQLRRIDTLFDDSAFQQRYQRSGQQLIRDAVNVSTRLDDAINACCSFIFYISFTRMFVRTGENEDRRTGEEKLARPTMPSNCIPSSSGIYGSDTYTGHSIVLYPTRI